MIFPTRQAILRTPLPYRGAPFGREMPIVLMEVERAGISISGRAYVDPMADNIILPENVAHRLQIDLTSAPAGQIGVIGGSQVTVHYAELVLTLRTPLQSCRWRAWVGFAATQRWLFGHFGGLEFFHFTLDSANEELILVPRENLPAVA